MDSWKLGGNITAHYREKVTLFAQLLYFFPKHLHWLGTAYGMRWAFGINQHGCPNVFNVFERAGWVSSQQQAPKIQQDLL